MYFCELLKERYSWEFRASMTLSMIFLLKGITMSMTTWVGARLQRRLIELQIKSAKRLAVPTLERSIAKRPISYQKIKCVCAEIAISHDNGY